MNSQNWQVFCTSSASASALRDVRRFQRLRQGRRCGGCAAPCRARGTSDPGSSKAGPNSVQGSVVARARHLPKRYATMIVLLEVSEHLLGAQIVGRTASSVPQKVAGAGGALAARRAGRAPRARGGSAFPATVAAPASAGRRCRRRPPLAQFRRPLERQALLPAHDQGLRARDLEKQRLERA